MIKRPKSYYALSKNEQKFNHAYSTFKIFLKALWVYLPETINGPNVLSIRNLL